MKDPCCIAARDNRIHAKLRKIIPSKKVILILAWSYLFALSWTIPLSLEGSNFAECFLFAIAPSAIICALIVLVSASGVLQTIRFAANDKIPAWPWCFTVLLAIWAIVLLINYPGAFSTDSVDIINMVSGLPFESDHFRYDSLNTHHPLAWVGFNAVVLKLASIAGIQGTGALGMLSFVQLIIFTACCTFFIQKTGTLSGSKIIWIASLIFFAANPLIAQYASTIWKDVLFSGFFAVFSIQLYACATTPREFFRSKLDVAIFVVAGLLCCILRNNGMIAVCTSLLLLAITLREYLKQIAPLCVAIAITSWLALGLTSSVAGAQPGHFSESIGVALQQIARTASESGHITAEQEEFIDQIIPYEKLPELYLPNSANPIKFDPEFNDEFLESHKMDFLVVWFEMGVHNPESFARAWCAQTEAFWNIDTATWYACEPGYPVDGEENYHQNKLDPYVEAESVSTATNLSISMFFPLFSMGSLAWITLFILLIKLLSKDFKSAACLTPFVTLWATYLVAAPASDFRYLLPLHVSLPLLLLILVSSSGVPMQTESNYTKAADS